MTIKINKSLRGSLLRLVHSHANPNMAREVELGRDKAWNDAFLSGGSVA